jgi:LacI family transcriptional regulator
MQLLQSGQPVDAILAINDEMALGALNASNRLGIRVPDQLAIAGCDNVLFSSTAFVPITTLDQNIGEMCRVMVHGLDDRISQPDKQPGPDDTSPIRLIAPVLVARNSSVKLG